MDRYKIPKEKEECVLKIEESIGRYITPYLGSALLREFSENNSTENPTIYASRFIEELKGKSFYFIKEVTRYMLIDAEMYCELKD